MKNKKLHVTGLGQCSWDYLSLIDSFPDPDSKCEMKEWHEDGGGPVATALVALARLGMDCSFYGVTGDDEEGEKIAFSLKREGIHIAHLLRRKNSTSQKAFIAVEKGRGRRTIFWKRPSGEALNDHELGEHFLAGSSFLLLDGLMREVSLFAAREARRKNIPVMLDAGTLREGMLELAKECDYVVASERFARDLGWKGDKEAFWENLKKCGLGLTTITLGERGSITFTEEEAIHMPAFQVETVDTTGAGDVFHGAYIYGILQEWDLKEVLRFASAAAALKCRYAGGRAGIVSSHKVRSFMESAFYR